MLNSTPAKLTLFSNIHITPFHTKNNFKRNNAHKILIKTIAYKQFYDFLQSLIKSITTKQEYIITARIPKLL